MRSLLIILFVCFIIAQPARATTWDEPWHDEVMRNSESFVMVKIIENQGSGVRPRSSNSWPVRALPSKLS